MEDATKQHQAVHSSNQSVSARDCPYMACPRTIHAQFHQHSSSPLIIGNQCPWSPYASAPLTCIIIHHWHKHEPSLGVKPTSELNVAQTWVRDTEQEDMFTFHVCQSQVINLTSHGICQYSSKATERHNTLCVPHKLLLVGHCMSTVITQYGNHSDGSQYGGYLISLFIGVWQCSHVTIDISVAISHWQDITHMLTYCWS